MLFLPILIVAIVLYMAGYRLMSLFLFFFFVFEGFQIVPEELFDTGVGITKPLDFALVYVFVLFGWGCLYYHDFIPKNKMSLLIAIYLGGMLILIGANKFIFGVGWGDIIRTARNYFFVLAYFPLRRVSKEEFEKLLLMLLAVVVVQCCLFTLESFTGKALLVGADDKFEGSIPYRFYNSPKMLYFFILYLIFYQPLGKKSSKIVVAFLIFTFLLPMHRGLTIILGLVIAFGYFLYMGEMKKLIRFIPYFVLVAIPLAYILFVQVGERTLTDLKNVQEGQFSEIDSFEEFEDFEMDSESTFTFRIAHLTERLFYAQEKLSTQCFGIGLMSEDSPYTKNHFNFVIGLKDDKTGGTIQLDTGDIAWSNFVVRYGLVGTIAYLVFFIGLAYFFFTHRRDQLSLVLLLYMLFIFGSSFTSNLLYQVHRLVFVLMLYEVVKNNIVPKEDAVATSIEH